MDSGSVLHGPATKDYVLRSYYKVHLFFEKTDVNFLRAPKKSSDLRPDLRLVFSEPFTFCLLTTCLSLQQYTSVQDDESPTAPTTSTAY